MVDYGLSRRTVVAGTVGGSPRVAREWGDGLERAPGVSPCVDRVSVMAHAASQAQLPLHKVTTFLADGCLCMACRYQNFTDLFSQYRALVAEAPGSPVSTCHLIQLIERCRPASMIQLNRLDRCGPHRVGCSEAMEHRKAKMVAILSGHDHVKRRRSRTDGLSTFVWFAAQIYTLYWCSARLAPRIEVTGSQCALEARAGASDAVTSC
jgi:hypothetical protein